MRLRFTKMHGLGNDFIMVDGINQRFAPVELARHLADRKRGVGCDQILIVERPDREGVDFKYRILNADGGEVAQCGNGARCFAVFVRAMGLTNKTSIRVQTRRSLMTLNIEGGDRVSVDMGLPEFNPPCIPFIADDPGDSYELDVNGTSVRIAALALGNPHAVQTVDDVDTAPVDTQGPLIEAHVRFPQRVNAGYLQVIDRGHARVRVYERGIGETLACGSGACAAVVTGRQWGLLNEKVNVELRGGPLDINWPGPGQPVVMTGPTAKVYDGEIELDNFL